MTKTTAPTNHYDRNFTTVDCVRLISATKFDHKECLGMQLWQQMPFGSCCFPQDSSSLPITRSFWSPQTNEQTNEQMNE